MDQAKRNNGQSNRGSNLKKSALIQRIRDLIPVFLLCSLCYFLMKIHYWISETPAKMVFNQNQSFLNEKINLNINSGFLGHYLILMENNRWLNKASNLLFQNYKCRVDTTLLILKFALVEMMSNFNKLRRPWTPQEDEALISLRDELRVAKWPQIAKRMVEKFKLEGRTEKQCRDRYVNFLRNTDDSYIWKIEDENKLMELYYELGNKWSEIAKYFPNTNGIFIKNKFYSRLRRAIRYLNAIIQSYFSETENKFSFDIIFKIVNFSTKKQKMIENPQNKELLDSNPKIFQDIIVKLISMTTSCTDNQLKKKKIKRINPKDQLKWKKLIEIFRYIDNQDIQAQGIQFSEKDFHLQMNHHGGFKSPTTLGIKNLLGLVQNSLEDRFQQDYHSTQNSICAGYVEINELSESKFNHNKPIMIISNQKINKELSHHIHDYSKKQLILQKNVEKSIFQEKEIQEQRSLADIIKGKILELPCQQYVISQP